MSYFPFTSSSVTNVKIMCNPTFSVVLNGNAVTGSVYLERPYLNPALANRNVTGFSERLGGQTTRSAMITASVDFLTAVSGGQNQQMFGAISNLYSFYKLQNANYTPLFTGSKATSFRVITIPAIYYDSMIQSGTFTGSDNDAAGASRFLYDDSNGGIYSGSLSGTLVGNIFYAEGFVVLKAPNLQNFGSASPNNFKWRTDFNGTQMIPCNIYQCRAPGGQLNASTNPSFFTVPASGVLQGTRQILSSSVYPYITSVGFYNEDFELIGVARLAQPIKKAFGWDITIKCKLDW